MTAEAFELLVRRLEKEAASSPATYKLRVAGLAALGFGYIFGIVALALVGIGIVGWAAVEQGFHGWQRRLVEPLAVLIYMIGRAVRIRLSAPEGVELKRSEVPALFGELDAIRKKMRAPRFHRVLLDQTMTAFVVQTPRLGLLGWQQNTVAVGLPLLQALTPAQARAVVAHEFGHLSGAHSRFGGWIYRVEATWTRLLEKLEEDDHWSSFLFRPFFRWYSPYFNAYTFVLRRANEYDADSAAAEFTSSRDVADALVSLSLKRTFLDHRLWDWIGRQRETHAEPDLEPHATMGRTLPSAPEAADAERWLPQFLAIKTTLDDTHPSLSDRLAALGQEPRIVPPVERSAADAWLGKQHARFARQFDEEWRDRVGDHWRTYHADFTEARDRIAALEQKAKEGPLEEGEAWEQAELVEGRCGAEAALPLYVALARRFPDRPAARFHAGRLLLEAGDRSGIAHIEMSMDHAADAIIPGCGFIVAFLGRNGESEAAGPYRERAAAHQAKLDAIKRDRESLPYSATYEAHGFSNEAVQPLIDALRARGDVKHAWLTRKQPKLSEEPVYILAVVRRVDRFKPATWFQNVEKQDRALQSQIARECPFPGETLVLVMNHRERRSKRTFMGNDAAQLF